MKLRKITLSMLMAFILVSITSITVSAATFGDEYPVFGYNLGWVLAVGSVVIIVILILASMFLTFAKGSTVKGKLPAAGVIFAFVAAFGLAIAGVEIPTETAEITPGVAWSVTASEHQGGNVTINNEDNSIIIMAHVNSTAGTILDDDNTAFTQPIINFTISPTVTEGLTDLQLGATTLANVVNPDQAFTVSGTSYDLYSDVSGTSGEKNLAWLADGTTEYEYHYCTVQFGTSEVARLTITYNPAGISGLTSGTVKTSTITIGGQTYTVSILITGVIT